MAFNTVAYGPELAQLFASDTPSLVGLTAGGKASAELKKSISSSLFTDSAHPKGALSGLWLYFDCFDESHAVSQEDESPEGSFWHAITHRREPDYSNAAYWFRRVARHAVFPQIVARVGTGLGSKWDPLKFVDYCETAAAAGGERLNWALAVQRAEWEILFDYCARKRSD